MESAPDTTEKSQLSAGLSRKKSISSKVWSVEMKTNKQLRRECVNHWKRMKKLSVEDILNGKESLSRWNCAFCRVYEFPAAAPLECGGCPVKETTGKKFCHDTPYEHAADLYNGIYSGYHRKIAAFRRAVQKEIDFLESLEC